ncbi:MAG: BMP family ABC transporter substrate-binding protein, partial [Cellulosilyticaceae bacterium]
MKKRLLSLLLCGVVSTLALVGCGSSDSTSTSLQVGMVTNSGTIEDKSYNQGTWEGIKRAETELNISTNYLKPAGTTETDYLKEITNLYDAGYKFIVTPGFKFETAIFNAQTKYPDAKFVILDGVPNDGTTTTVAENTVSISFAEHEAGFLAGVATALEQKTGDVGFLGGMEIPSIVRFHTGFEQGINYANTNLDTNVTLSDSNAVYQGSFDNVPAGQQIAAQMYDKGVQTIFCAAGDVGIGVITEAVERASKGDNVWVVGVDVDQYSEGIYTEGKSVVLTSAVKKIDNAAFDMIQSELNGSFPGGQTLTFDAKNNGVGL